LKPRDGHRYRLLRSDWPVTGETARAILAGDLSGLTVADGWPHEDTADGLALALEHGHLPGWLITADGTVIGFDEEEAVYQRASSAG
jgi:hypothetical protein